MTRSTLVIILFFVGFTSKLLADDLKINVKITGLENKEVCLGYHYGEKNYLIDTILLDKNGVGLFEGEKLPGGMYIVVFPTKDYFELILSDNQVFSLETSSISPVAAMKIKGSIENEVFYDYQRKLTVIRSEESHLKERLAYNRHDNDSVRIITTLLKKNSEELEEMKKKLVEQHPDLFFSTIMRAMQNPVPPHSPRDEHGNVIDSLFEFHYYRNHYWDGFDFSDGRLLRTSILVTKLETYFKNLCYPYFDSLKLDVDMIASKSGENMDIYRYTMFYVLKLIEMSWGAEMDDLFIYISEGYFLNNPSNWNPVFIQQLDKRVKEVSPTMIGKVGEDLNMQSPDGEFVRLHQLKGKYKLLIFWDTDCDHCKQAVPEMIRITKIFKKKDFEVFAVYVGTDKEKWENYLEENDPEWTNVYDPDYVTAFRDKYDIYRTPEVYILDKDNIIVARRVETENLEKTIKELIKRVAE